MNSTPLVSKENQVILGDCLELMKNIPDNSIDLIVTDPPYNIKKDHWDKIDDYQNWCIGWILECQRVLKDNGSFYFFHNNMPVISKLMYNIEKNTNFIFKQFIIWNKKFKGANNEGFLQGFNEVEGLRNYQKMAEYCLFYTFQDETGLTTVYGDIENFKPIREYMTSEKIKSGLKTCKQINTLLEVDSNGGGMASHFFSATAKQWTLPTEEMYKKLQSTGYFQKSYESLRQEYESLRQEYESLRYTFNNQKSHHSVWNYEVASKMGHITPKPVEMIKNIILHSSNNDSVILDPFAGSGTTAIACLNLDRNYICIEKEPKYYEMIKNRIESQTKKITEFVTQ